MEKLGIEPANPGLQGTALIHYITGYKSPEGEKVIILAYI